MFFKYVKRMTIFYLELGESSVGQGVFKVYPAIVWVKVEEIGLIIVETIASISVS